MEDSDKKKDLSNKLKLLENRIIELEEHLAEKEIQLGNSKLLKRYKAVLDNIGVGIAFISPNMEILDLNRQMREWFPRIDVSKKSTCFEAFNDPPREDICTYCPTYKTLKDGKVHESITDTPMGAEIINFRIVSSAIKDDEGNVVAAVEMVEDISKRKKGEQELKQSEEKFRAVAESAIDAIITTDYKGIILFFNHSLLELFGYSASELVSKPVSILIPAEHKNGHVKGIKSFKSGEMHRTGKTSRVVGLKKDGTEFSCEMSLSAWKSGEDTYFTSIIRDLTERQKAEEALRASEEKYRTIFENVQDVFFQTDIKGKIIEVSPSVKKHFGISPKELVGNHVDTLYFNIEDRKKLLKVLREKREVSDYEIELRNTENQLVYISANVHFIYDSKNHPIGIEGALRDITERKLAEKALKNSETEYRAIFENSKSAVAVYNAVSNGSDFIFKDFNQSAEKIDEIKREDVIGRKVTEVFPGMVEFGIFEVFQRVWKTGKPEKYPVSFYRDERIEGWRENYVYKLPSDDIVAVYDDLTEIKQYEEELEKNQIRLKSLVRILQYRGKSVQELLDYALEEALQLTESKIGYIYHYHEDKKLFVLNTWSSEVMNECSVTDPQTTYELDKTGIWGEAVRQRKPIILNDFQAHHPLKKGCPDGHAPLYKYLTIPVFSGDKIVAVVGMANKDTDYTETDMLQLELLMDSVWKVLGSQKAEETIRENEERLEILFEYAPDPYFISSLEGKILDGNKAVEGFIGYKKEEYVDKTVNELDLINEEDSLRIGETMAQLAQGQHLDPMEWRIRKKDGTVISAETTAFPIEIKGQKTILIMGRDITERKKAEEELKLSQIRLANAMDLANLANWELDPYKLMFIFNDKFYSILGTTAENEGGYHLPIEYYIKKYVHPEDAQFIADGMKKSLAVREPTFGTEFEHRIIRTDGEIRYVAIHIRVIPATEIRNAYVYGAVQDITEHKIAEEKLKESLEEKEMLLKEIHHRVKNNLMVISSLLNLQSQYIKDKEALDIFKESQNRAKSMALIHERLYRSTDLKKIDFGDYIHTLATDLFHTYVADPGRVKLNMNLENVMVDINTTVPLGLIVNELVTNTMKHAFPEGGEGEINIEFHKHEDEFILIVSDTGVGFPEDLDFQNTDSLGLQLVNNLVKQIDGEITLNRRQGTEFKIIFKESEY